jgi:hypothetical protein
VSVVGCVRGESAPRTGADIASPYTTAQSAAFYDTVEPFVADTCFRCHDADRTEADLDLESFLDSGEMNSDIETWERVRDMLISGQMPPPKRPRPDPEELAEVTDWIEGRVHDTIVAMPPDPGRVTARRLNRAEYNNTVRDLLGVNIDAAAGFPIDDSGYGFDTIGDVLSISPLLMEKYLDAAEVIAARAIEADLQEIEVRSEPGHVIICGHAPDAHTAACARRLCRNLAERAFRRPVSATEVRRLKKIFTDARKDGAVFHEAAELVSQAVLVSPHFLFRIERTRPEVISLRMRDIGHYELASRLSYFLWSSMPDDRLFRLAEERRLREPGVMESEVRRMLLDSKSEALITNFAGQWLELRNMEEVHPDPDRFPEYNDALRDAMRQETEMLFATIVQEDLSVSLFLDADFTFLNEQLANHYGIEGVDGHVMRRVPLDGSRRGGLLTQASILTLTSYPTRTSPVLRGKWVLENLLGTPPPPPPANVPPLDETKAETAQSLRAQLEQHRADPGCASCHSMMDPLGFGLENYDPIGRWRESQLGEPIDSSGELPSGERFANSAELRSVLLVHREDFVRCITEKMLIYALGRGLERYDKLAVDEICDQMEQSDFRFSTLVTGIADSLPFQKRRGENL